MRALLVLIIKIISKIFDKKVIFPSSFFKRGYLFGRNPDVISVLTTIGLLDILENVVVAHPRSIYILDSNYGIVNFTGKQSVVEFDAASYLPYVLRDIKKKNGLYCVKRNIPPNNYYHFFIDVILPYLIVKDCIPDLKILFNYKIDKKFQDYLDSSSIAYDCGDNENKINKLIILPGDFLKNNNSQIKESVSRLYFNTQIPKKIRKIFINRRYGCRSLRENIAPMLQRYGFDEYFTEDYSIAEQANIVNSASHLVGIHGAGITNIIFNKSPNLFEIIPKDPWGSELGYGGGCFRELCLALGGRYTASIGTDLVNGLFDIDYIDLEKRIATFAELSYSD